MKTREEVIAYCVTKPLSYEDYPFDDPNWTVMRRKDTKKGFAWIFSRSGNIWINVKLAPDWGHLLQSAYESIQPAYHMNKTHWTSVILDDTVPEELIIQMIDESYRLCGK